MRDRYYVRTDRVKKALEKAGMVAYREWKMFRQDGQKPAASYGEYYHRWMLEKHNIVVSNQANGVEKVGFASRGDMLLFVLKWG